MENQQQCHLSVAPHFILGPMGTRVYAVLETPQREGSLAICRNVRRTTPFPTSLQGVNEHTQQCHTRLAPTLFLGP